MDFKILNRGRAALAPAAHFRPGVAASGPSPRPRGRLQGAAGEAESGRGSRTGALSCSLTWRGHLRNGARTASPRVCRCRGRKPDCANPAEANVEESEPTLLLKPEDIVLKEPGSSEKTLRTLLRPGDKVSNHYKTTSSEISAVVGAVPSTCYPTYGVPTIRSDLPAPLIRRVSDRRSYGEEGNAYSLLHPTVFAQKGVFERDFFKTRSKQEISEILCNIGVKLSEDEFENVWNLASKKHHRGEVCVENIRNVLDELQHADRAKCKAAT